MEGTYPVYHGSQTVGQAEVIRRGLYYHFFCRLHLTGEVIFRLEIRCGDTTENLGIPVPEGGAFILRKTLPVSRFGRAEPRFCIFPRHAPLGEIFVPLHPEEPFAYLTRLETAFLQRRGQQLGVVIRE